MSKRPQVVVIGSINMDFMIRCDHLPVPGQTLIATSATEVPGGKGANQAVAASRAGGEVTLVGRVGSDSLANQLLENLRRHHVHTESIRRCDEVASGLAIVAVEESGENSIIVVPGANELVSVEDVDGVEPLLRAADIVLLQLEIPLATVLRVIEIATEAKIRVVLDPAPMPKSLPREALLVDVICPNQTEAASILGYEVATVADAHRAAGELVSLGSRCAIITLADQGAVVHDGTTSHWIEPFPVHAIDTTAAGDAFAGALAVRLAEGASILHAVRFAAAAGAIAATRLGAQPAMPSREEIEQRLC